MFYSRQRTIIVFKYNFASCCVVSAIKGMFGEDLVCQ